MNMFQWFKDYMNGHPLRWLAWYVLLSWIFIIGLGMSAANAADANLSWVHPVTYTDGTPLPLSSISTTEVEYGLCNAGKTGFVTPPALIRISVPAPTAARTITGLTPGIWCFRARSFAIGNPTPSDWTINADGTHAWKEILPPKPKPPTSLTLG